MRRKRFFVPRLIIFLVIATVVGLGFVWNTQIEDFVNFNILNNTRAEDSDVDVIIGAELSIHFISVGQGDAAVIELPGGEIIMIDAGNERQSSIDAVSHYLTNVIFRDQTTARYIDWFIATHSHADHIGATATTRRGSNESYLFDNYYVKNIIRPKSFTSTEIAAQVPNTFGLGTTGPFVEHDTNLFNNFVRVIDAHTLSDGSSPNITIPYAGKIIGPFACGTYIRFYSPTSAFYAHSSSSSRINKLSTMFSVNFAGRRIMFTGDAYVFNETNFINNLRADVGAGLNKFGFPIVPEGEIYRVDVLDIGHHGSRTSTSQAFLEKIQPRYAIVQVGASNNHGHPTPQVMSRLEAIVANNYGEVLQTRHVGDILIQIEANGDMTVQGNMVPAEISVWINYWMIAMSVIIVAFAALLAMDFFGKKGGASGNRRTGNQPRNNQPRNTRNTPPANNRSAAQNRAIHANVRR